MTQQIRNPISSELLPSLGRQRARCHFRRVTDTLTHLTNEAINNLAGGLQSAPPKKEPKNAKGADPAGG